MGKNNLRMMTMAMLLLILLTPIGLIAAGTAFGEWGTDELKDKIGYVPPGLMQLSDLWKAPMPDYGISGVEGTVGSMIGYVASALVGVILCGGLLYILGKKIANKDAE